MQKHVSNYLKHHGYSPGEWIPCEECNATAVDIHHILKRSQGGGDNPENLKALCRNCHENYH